MPESPPAVNSQQSVVHTDSKRRRKTFEYTDGGGKVTLKTFKCA